MPRTLPESELAHRAVEILLNKVAGLEWYYFNVSNVNPANFGNGDSTIFEHLVPNGTKYAWPDDREAPNDQQLFAALFAALNKRPQVAIEAFRRIFDLDAIPNQSGAFGGMLGELNAREQSERTESFLKLLRKRACRDRVVVLAEGDSWFQFPRIPVLGRVVRDILDHLMDRKDMCLESIAAGGDWLSNMLHSREYVEALSQLEPDVFLFSGGGNDLLGEGRAGNMVVHNRNALDLRAVLVGTGPRANLYDKRTSQYPNEVGEEPRYNWNRFAHGLTVLADEFFQFLNLVFVQYLLFLTNLRQSTRFQDMLVVTQGYDFVVPKRKSTAPFWAIRRYVNNAIGSGKWLWIPFEKKELNEERMNGAAYAMVFEFNELLMSIVNSDGVGPMAHIDSRGQAGDDADWYDEIHLTSKAFERVAKLYVLCMRNWLDDNLLPAYTTAQQVDANEAWRWPLPPRA